MVGGRDLLKAKRDFSPQTMLAARFYPRLRYLQKPKQYRLKNSCVEDDLEFGKGDLADGMTNPLQCVAYKRLKSRLEMVDLMY